MRMIDADALMEHYKDMQGYERCACNFENMAGWPSTEWYCVENALENAPTIDAIPVEWLEQWRNRLNAMGDYQRECADSIDFVQRLWQKEQEAR